ncbi:RidA family protein [Pseudomonas sp. MYb185]|uniref:RidA family protein n=1 Tax=Pseudomonas sp. MYb185 TaxID=1848729 RepID=UPI000CFC3465|nr:RidA family protein [Pseudomonas sp. MYb185]PRB79395.1 hypothetical protein CQ007_15315 [Pseudomonas sp. MYb185]
MNTQALYSNVRMSQTLVHQDMVYLAGRFADSAPLENDLREQADNILMAIERLLIEAGTDKTRLLSATIYLKNIEADIEAMDLIWKQWLPEGVTPARATLEADALKPDILVEVAIIATL